MNSSAYQIETPRDYANLTLLVGCGLRRAELASLDVKILQGRENCCVLADLRDKGDRLRTVAGPLRSI